jgi:hypothetical protein
MIPAPLTALDRARLEKAGVAHFPRKLTQEQIDHLYLEARGYKKQPLTHENSTPHPRRAAS